MLRFVLSVFLIVEGVLSGVFVAGLLTALPGHSATVIALVALRMLVGMLQFTGGWLLRGRRPPGDIIARLAFFASAVLTTFETGLRLVPSNADPTYRWMFVGVYWVYALGMIWLVRKAVPADQ